MKSAYETLLSNYEIGGLMTGWVIDLGGWLTGGVIDLGGGVLTGGWKTRWWTTGGVFDRGVNDRLPNKSVIVTKQENVWQIALSTG